MSLQVPNWPALQSKIVTVQTRLLFPDSNLNYYTFLRNNHYTYKLKIYANFN
jgi:hypothetical protein